MTTTKMGSHDNNKWHPVEGFNGHLYYNFFFCVYENSDLADNEGNFKKHLLLEFLNELGVISYHRDYDMNGQMLVYEIVMRDKSGK